MRGVASLKATPKLTAWGLDSEGDGVNWRVRGACRDRAYDANLWTSPKPEDRGQAVWVCNNVCAVRTTCRRWADQNRNLVRDCVYGGILWTSPRNRTEVRPSGIQPAPRRPTGEPAHGDEQHPVTAGEQVVLKLIPDIDQIGDLWAAGASLSALAARYQCSRKTMTDFIAAFQLRRAENRKPCGDMAGYRQHRKAREKPCGPCGDAKRAYNRELRTRERA